MSQANRIVPRQVKTSEGDVVVRSGENRSESLLVRFLPGSIVAPAASNRSGRLAAGEAKEPAARRPAAGAEGQGVGALADGLRRVRASTATCVSLSIGPPRYRARTARSEGCLRQGEIHFARAAWHTAQMARSRSIGGQSSRASQAASEKVACSLVVAWRRLVVWRASVKGAPPPGPSPQPLPAPRQWPPQLVSPSRR